MYGSLCHGGTKVGLSDDEEEDDEDEDDDVDDCMDHYAMEEPR